MDGQPDALLQQLAQVDQQFPVGLRSDRPYEDQDILWNGPFFGKGGPQLIKNPISGAPMPMAPMTTPAHYLAAVNTMAEAKARARANVLRGWSAEQSASEALARAWGVDPAQVQGQDPKTAQGVIQGNVAGRREEFQQGQEERRTRQGDESLRMQREEYQQRFDDRRAALDEKQQRRGELDSALEGLPRAQEYLSGLPADKAFQLAPGILAPLAKAGSPIYEQVLTGLGVRAQREAQAQQDEAKAAQDHLKRVGDAAKRLDDQMKPLFAELAKPAAVKYADVDNPPGGIPGKTRQPQYDNAFEERLASIMSVINQTSSLDPGIGESLKLIEAQRDNPDKREALGKLDTFARSLEQRLREILGEQKASLQTTGD
jgi:hypothetical protein